jgi:YD repeat-containing protein
MVPSRVVTSRTTEAAGTTIGTWTFAYGQGAAANETVVTTPCGVETYRYLGVGTAGPFNAWRAGVLAERTTAEPGGPVLEREELTWSALDAISPDAIPPVPGGSDGDPAIYVPRLVERRVTRGPQSWRTAFDFHLADGRFNDYGRPWRVRAYDESDVTYRAVETSFDYGFLQSPQYPYVLPVASVTEWLGTESAATTFAYDLLTGFVTSTTVRGVTTTFTRTSRGNVASVRDAANRTTTIEYSWAVASVITPPAVSPVAAPTITRGVSSHSLVTWERVGPAIGGLTTTFEYDAAGRLTSVTPPGGGSSRWPTVYNYNPTHSRYLRAVQGDVQVPATQRVTLTDLDYFGRAIRTTQPDGVKVEIGYDACGRVTAQSLPYSGTAWQGWGTTATYDALGRVLSTTTVTGPGTSSTTTWAYTGADVTMTDPAGRTTTADYQAFGDPAAARLRAITDAAGFVMTYQYSLAGQVREVRGPGTGPTPSGPVRTWVYDGTTGRLLSDTQPESGTTTYGYESGTGRLTLVTQADGTSTTLLWDAAGRPTGRDVAGTTADDVAVTYDALGRVSTQRLGPAGAGVTTTWSYDATTGRLLSRQDAVDGRTFTSTYGYNAYDDVVQVGYPRVGGTGRLVSYAIDATTARLTGITTSVNGVATAFASSFQYDGAGRLTSYQTGPVTHTVAYDAASRPTAIGAGLPGAAPAQRLDLGYTYNAVSEVTAITDGRAGAGQSFTYDALGRIRTATGPYGSLTWTHDATGNRTEVVRNGVATTYGYHTATQRLTSVGGAGAETLAYDALGRVTSDGQGTYTYRAGGAVATVTRAGLSASYDYDSEGWRVRRTVNGTTTYTVRGPGQQTLSTFEVACGGTTTVWTRDLIYAAGRLLGAISRGPSTATVALASATASVGEGAGPVAATVVLATSDGSPLVCPVTVAWATSNGTAVAGADYTASSGTVSFGAGSASGSTRAISVPVLDDALDEPDETFTITLSGPSGASLGAVIAQTVTIVDNDAPPTLTVSCPTVSEDVGLATCTVTPSGPSAFAMSVTFATADGTALGAAGDYQPVSGYVLSWSPGQAHAQTVAVAITNDAWTEPAETIRGRLVSPVNATLAGAGEALLTISANDGTRVAIDPSLPSQYLADLDASPGVEDYLLIGNPTATPTTARLTYVRPNGSGVTRDVAVGAWGRLSVHVGSDPVIGGQGLVSVAVQSLHPGVPLDAEHAPYRDGWTVGRATEGVAPASTWWLAEGHVGAFEEYLTVFNTEPVAVGLTVTAYRPDGTTATRQEVIGAGPGRWRVRVRDWTALGLGDHGTQIAATRLDTGGPAGIVVERTQEWWVPGRQAATSSPGVSTLSTVWHFAEGNKGLFDAYYQILNPQSFAQTVWVTYRHENGVVYSGSLTVGARSRVTVTLPSWLPDGALGVTLRAAQGFVAERALYGGTGWTLGHAGVPAPVGATTWRFAEGVTGSFDTFFLLANVTGTATTATLTSTTALGAK